MRKLRTGTTLRKEAEDQNRKIQQEKLALESYLQNLPSLDEFQQNPYPMGWVPRH